VGWFGERLPPEEPGLIAALASDPSPARRARAGESLLQLPVSGDRFWPLLADAMAADPDATVRAGLWDLLSGRGTVSSAAWTTPRRLRTTSPGTPGHVPRWTSGHLTSCAGSLPPTCWPNWPLPTSNAAAGPRAGWPGPGTSGRPPARTWKTRPSASWARPILSCARTALRLPAVTALLYAAGFAMVLNYSLGNTAFRASPLQLGVSALLALAAIAAAFLLFPRRGSAEPAALRPGVRPLALGGFALVSGAAFLVAYALGRGAFHWPWPLTAATSLAVAAAICAFFAWANRGRQWTALQSWAAAFGGMLCYAVFGYLEEIAARVRADGNRPREAEPALVFRAGRRKGGA